MGSWTQTAGTRTDTNANNRERIFMGGPGAVTWESPGGAHRRSRSGARQARGPVPMPLGADPWIESFGCVKDRFGVSWRVIPIDPTA